MRLGRAIVLGALEALLERAADGARDRLDALASWWILNRRHIDRDRAAELVERLGEQLGAKIELRP